jgi:hypothetical protein
MTKQAVMDHRWVELARTLRGLGLWRHLPDDVTADAEQAVATGGYPFASHDGDQDVRRFFVDGEAMAEDGVVRVLADLAPALRAHGVELRLATVNRPLVDDAEGEYVVAINDRRCIVWTPDDWTAQRAWETATVRPLAVVNDLLAEAGATVRLFTLLAGTEDAIALLLDPRIVAAVADSGLVRESGVPARATHDTLSG